MAFPRLSGAMAPSSLLSSSNTRTLNQSSPRPADSSSASTLISPFLRSLNLFSYLLAERGLDEFITNLAVLHDSNFTGTNSIINISYYFIAYASPFEFINRIRIINTEIFCFKTSNFLFRIY
jgi:hypothetical protein